MIFAHLNEDLVDDENHFAKIVSMQIITNKNILEIDDKIRDVSMLIIIKKKHVEMI